MPPKVKVTKEAVLSAGLALVRAQGAEALNARSVAQALGCSTQPIFSNYATMEALRADVLLRADAIYQDRIAEAIKSADTLPYKASGMAYILFAKEEPQLFRLLFMRDRTGETVGDNREELRPILSLIQASTGFSEDEALHFHLELWVFVHGIAVMEATGYLDWDTELIGEEMTTVYTALRDKKLRKRPNGKEESK